MIERTIAAGGEILPAVGLGTWQAFDVAGSSADYDQAREALAAFVAGGGRLVDTSPMYGKAEARIGDLCAELGVRPFLATKVWTRGRDGGVAQMEASFQKLRTEVIDLMQVHNLLDLEVHMPTLRAWKDAGRLRYLGLTHYHRGAHGELAAAMRRHPVEFVQINYSAAEPEAENGILPLAQELGMAVIVNRPFAGGELRDRLKRAPLPAWAAEVGATSWGQLLLKWVLAHPAVTCAIPGTRKAAHVADNLAAGEGPLPDGALRRRIAEAVRAL